MIEREKESLNKFGKNKYSQNGEDGIIEIILSRLNLYNSDKCLCVEFGAWDGKLFSNTFNLVEKGWNAIYIEGDEQRFKELLKTCLKFPKITPINTYISKDKFSDNSIDNILKKYSVPKDFDILSIDIDSFDLDVWESMENYNPKIVIIEINSSIPVGILSRHNSKISGNSFTSTLSVGSKKNYTLVCHTGNLIFIKNDLVKNIQLPQEFLDNPEKLFITNWLSDDLFTNSNKKFLEFIKAKFPKFLRPIFKKIKHNLIVLRKRL